MRELYNGHPDWGHWNVSLWLMNDEDLYRLVRAYCTAVWDHKMHPSDCAAEMVNFLADQNYTHTPDGAAITHERALYVIKNELDGGAA